MRIVFLGTSELAVPCLRVVQQHVVGVVTQPDRPAGRHLQLTPPAVKFAAQSVGLPVVQPEKIREWAALEIIRQWRPDLIVVVAYGQILPAELLSLPPLGCVNVHASLLPRWRGAAPIQYAIWHGDTETGVTTMYLNERMDAGDIILQRATPILPDDTAATLHDRLAILGAELLRETVGLIEAGKAPRIPQHEVRATYARKISKEQGRANWTRPAHELERQMRAFDPWPGVFTQWGDRLLKLWRGRVRAGRSAAPGTLQSDLTVATADDSLELIEVQPAGGRRMGFAEFYRGHPLPPGTVLG
ncbi:MAG: methionyl-tRNA formyltransferase [Verrucomicrobiae bacterium]|nr:methionyl-tRNA formyltransferase [Verrucomicrobiae bacterium]